MKQFRCCDVVPGCQWITRNDDEQQLFQDISVHARNEHGMVEVVDQIRGVITEV